MCESCGCGKPDEFTIKESCENENSEKRKAKSEINGDHHHSHDHMHDHDHHSHEHMHEHDGHWHSHGDEENSEKRKAKSEIRHEHKEIPLNIDILAENNKLAERNRGYFDAKKVVCLNMVSSPGSGKTSILEKTIKELISKRKIFVIEGDQQTTRDAERIEKSGAPSIQINTGTGCHLDARMVSLALKKMEVENQSLLFIENVGNLVCPALFDLGESKRVIVISVTEGDDKPLKYPYMFETSHLCIINKTDLLPYVDFSVEEVKKNALQINPNLEFILMSAKTGEGMKEWYEWIEQNK
ncbi:MAG: hydrogenase nickel incorporation protein HypB [Bacteroidota bacterium]|jgi:hydrogenase nickel incorporation protein HypB